MRRLKGELCSFLDASQSCPVTNLEAIRKDPGQIVETYAALVEKVAALAFYNPEWVLFFRGQAKDYIDEFGSTLRPRIFRSNSSAKNMDGRVLSNRFAKLEQADELLRTQFALGGKERIKRHQILRWAILQHYEVCDTPLLDVTHSLRVAVAFALQHCATEFAYVHVLALPQITGSISTSSEHAIQLVRLNSICPPTARRPFFQEGYLMGTFPLLDLPKHQAEYAVHEADCARRLICKFRLPAKGLADIDQYGSVPYAALFPDSGDSLLDLCNEIKQEIALVTEN